jgi:uncharacterized protein (TIGR03790 family)
LPDILKDMLALVLLASLVQSNNYADRVLVVINADSPTSLAIGADYLKLRGVKDKVIVHFPDSSVSSQYENTLFAPFRDQILTPLQAYLAKHPKIDFIVLTKGIPIRILDAPGMGFLNNRPSVDSYIASMDYGKIPGSLKIVINEGTFKGTCYANRFWNSNERFSHAKFGGYLVTRLDGYTTDDARLLTRYAIQSEKTKPTGEILIDSNMTFTEEELKAMPIPIFAIKPDPADPAKALADVQYKNYTMDMDRAGELLKARGLPVHLDVDAVFTTGTDLMGYCSWGSNDGKFDAANYKKIRFAPGGIAETAVSTSGRTFLPTTGGQSLIADLIQGRVTGVKGYCDEPLLTAIASPTILFDRYTKGWTLAESFYAASRWTGWEDIVIGDPICQPYNR